MKREIALKFCVLILMLLVCGASMALAEQLNDDFSSGLASWTIEWGTVTDGGGFALFEEDTLHLSSTISQKFTLDNHAEILSFDAEMSVVAGGVSNFAPWDAFMASLLDPVTYNPLISNPGFTEFYFLENTGFQETVADVIGTTVSLDVSSLAGQQVMLSFDLFGGDDGYQTSFSLDNILTRQVPLPGTLSLLLAGSGIVGYWRKSRFAK